MIWKPFIEAQNSKGPYSLQIFVFLVGPLCVLEPFTTTSSNQEKYLKDLDDAVLRRFTKRIYVRLPCTADRSRLVQQLLGQQYNELSEREVLSIHASSSIRNFLGVIKKLLIFLSHTRLISLFVVRCIRLHSWPVATLAQTLLPWPEMPPMAQ